MIGDFYAILFLVLSIVPFSFLGFYPFLQNLRYSKGVIASAYFLILTCEIATFFINGHSILPQLIFCFHIGYALFSISVIRSSLYKQLFIAFLLGIYQMLLVGVSIACEQWVQPGSGLDRYLIANLLIALQFALSYQIFFKFMDEKINSFVLYEDTAVWKWIWLIPGCIMAILVITNPLTLNMQVTLKDIVSRIFAGGGAFSCCLILIKTIEAIREKQFLEKELMVTEKMRQVQANYYESLSEHIAATRTMRHDLRHQFFALQKYLLEGRVKEALSYLKKNQVELGKLENKPLCANEMLDALLQEWLAAAEKLDIKTDVQLDLPSKLPVDDFDLCVLIGNLLDNAGEACRRMEQGECRVALKMRVLGNMLVLTLDNTYDGMCIYNGEQLLSSKRGYQEPGIGLGSVAAIVSKYQGELKVGQEENVFCVSVLLKSLATG